MIFSDNVFEKYKEEAREKWGNTEAWAQYEKKAVKHSKDKHNALADATDAIMAEFAECLKSGEAPSSETAQSLVKKLQLRYVAPDVRNGCRC